MRLRLAKPERLPMTPREVFGSDLHQFLFGPLFGGSTIYGMGEMYWAVSETNLCWLMA